MQRIWKHLRIGLKWIIGGWRLFMRNPWTLGGMGFSTAMLIGVISPIPLVGALLMALLAPLLLASAYLAIDAVYKQKMALPAALRQPALQQSPRQLVAVLRHEARLLPIMVACIYSLVVVLLINLLVRLLLGEVWVANWSNLDLAAHLGMIAAALLIFTLYVLLGASLIYALPLAFLRDDPLIPSLVRSLKASRHFVVALLVLLGLLLTPFLMGAIVCLLSLWASYVVTFILDAVILPVVATSRYCSYRNIFIVKDVLGAPENR